MKLLFDKRARISLSITLFLFLFSLIAFSQVSRNHRITVVVNTITVMQVSVGTVNLNITGANAIAGQDAMSVIDQSSTLLWGTNSSAQKITIKTNLTPQKFEVMALAVNPTYGTASPERALSTTPNDFLTNIGRSSGSASIRYTGVALASQGTGNDSHLITLTIVAQ